VLELPVAAASLHGIPAIGLQALDDFPDLPGSGSQSIVKGVHAEAGGITEALCRRLLTWRKPPWALDSSENAALLAAGARPLKLEGVRELAC
jgi:hypothetical protein